jgi:hypothetical protein
MYFVHDSFDTGQVVSASLTPLALQELEPALQGMLAGRQLFVKQRDGTYKPKGSELGLPRNFVFAELQVPEPRPHGI